MDQPSLISTMSRVKEFIENTPHVESGDPVSLNLPKKTQIPPEVVPPHASGGSDYQSQLKYKTNADFIGDDLVAPSDPPSAPNTFHYKKGNNAKTKDLGTEESEVKTEPKSELQVAKDQIMTSTLNGDDPPPPLPPNFGEWPLELAEQWLDHDHSKPQMDLGLIVEGGDTMIHKQEGKETPMWKHVHQQYQKQTPQLDNIFEKKEKEEKEEVIDDLMLLTFLAIDEHKPKGYKFPPSGQGSPLKLYNAEYDTFTKNKFDGVLQNFHKKLASQSTNRMPSKVEAVSSSSAPTSRVPSSTDKNYMKNANDVFKRIQGRGFPMHEVHPSISNTMTTATLTPKHNKVTGGLVTDDDLLWTLGYADDDDEDDPRPTMATMDMVNDITHSDHDDEYTEYDPQPPPLLRQVIVEEDEDEDDYTWDDEELLMGPLPGPLPGSVLGPLPGSLSGSLQGSLPGGMTTSIPQPLPITPQVETYEDADVTKNQLRERVAELEALMRSYNPAEVASNIEELLAENEKLKRQLDNDSQSITMDTADALTPAYNEISRLIKFKRASQLRLGPLRESNRERLGELELSKATKIDASQLLMLKGFIANDSSFPKAVGGMKYDASLRQWVGNSENTVLDLIEDLLSDAETAVPHKQLAMKKSRKRGNLEVLFVDVPDGDVSRTSSHAIGAEVTQVSQLADVLFSQLMRRLVGAVTDVFALGEDWDNWHEVERLDLTGYQLDNVKDLSKILPKLTDITLSGNRLLYLEGVNAGVKMLNVLDNQLNNLTTFAHLPKLHKLNLAKNLILGFGALAANDSLLILNISGNKITSLKGLEHLRCLTELNCSHNNISGEVNFAKLKLGELVRVKLLNNKITAITEVNGAPKLTILQVNENSITSITSNSKHMHLKKLELKFNQIRRLNLSPYPALKVLRIDGNNLAMCDFHRLGYLEELSAKSQPNLNIVELVVKSASDVRMLDLSGNQFFDIIMYSQQFDRGIQANLFKNLNKLVLIAMDLTKIPPSFSNMFPNVRLLNLNFNRLGDISGLNGLQNLTKLYLVSNDIKRVKTLLQGLQGARDSLKVLDVRLNPCTVDMYPYVFSPDECEANTTMIALDRPDDIDNFVIHYDSINRNGEQDWVKRDSQFRKLVQGGKRHKYELYMLLYFWHLRKLDGTSVSGAKREAMVKEYKERAPNK